MVSKIARIPEVVVRDFAVIVWRQVWIGVRVLRELRSVVRKYWLYRMKREVSDLITSWNHERETFPYSDQRIKPYNSTHENAAGVSCDLDWMNVTWISSQNPPSHLNSQKWLFLAKLIGAGEVTRCELTEWTLDRFPELVGWEGGTHSPQGWSALFRSLRLIQKFQWLDLCGFYLHGRFCRKMLTTHHQRVCVPGRDSESKCEASHSDRVGKGIRRRSMGSSPIANRQIVAISISNALRVENLDYRECQAWLNMNRSIRIR
jgi:hypothetical protein